MTTEIETWDAVVIGAGIAGNIVAVQLADRGAKVLLVEAKRFPRPKTCGGCLNPRAIESLQQAGFGATLESCQTEAIDRIEIYHHSRTLTIGLPHGQAVTRMTLDAAMLNEARQRGVVVREGVRARVEPEVKGGYRQVRLKGDAEGSLVQARVVLSCEGLGHSSLTGVPGFSAVVTPQSRAGLGAVVEEAAVSAQYPRGAIVMAVGQHGYVGLAVCEQQRLNLAAAFDPPILRKMSATEAVSQTLSHSGLPPLSRPESISWRGSPLLSQQTSSVAGERLLLLGDSAGYVEPFTGEGMAAAAEGALAVTPIAIEAMQGWSDHLAEEWQSSYTRRVRRSQTICRALAWILRRPLATKVSLGAAAMAPAIGRAVAAKVSHG